MSDFADKLELGDSDDGRITFCAKTLIHAMTTATEVKGALCCQCVT